MSDPLLDAAAAISPTSPATKRFAQLAAERIIALEPHAPPPASTPTPTITFNGGAGSSLDPVLQRANPGDVIGCSGICTYSVPINRGGTKDRPIVLTSADRTKPFTLQLLRGLDLRDKCAWWTFDYFHVDDVQGLVPFTLASAGSDLLFDRLSYTNHQRHIGFNLIDDPQYGRATRTTVRRCRGFEIGPAVYDNRSHGIYDEGLDTVVEDSLFYLCSARAIQARASTNGRYDYNTAADNGMGIDVGDVVNGLSTTGMSSKGCLLAYNAHGNIYSYNNGGGHGDSVQDFAYIGGSIGPLDHVTTSGAKLLAGDPFVSRATRNYRTTVGYGTREYPPL